MSSFHRSLDSYITGGRPHQEEARVECKVCQTVFDVTLDVEYGGIVDYAPQECPYCEAEFDVDEATAPEMSERERGIRTVIKENNMDPTTRRQIVARMHVLATGLSQDKVWLPLAEQDAPKDVLYAIAQDWGRVQGYCARICKLSAEYRARPYWRGEEEDVFDFALPLAELVTIAERNGVTMDVMR